MMQKPVSWPSELWDVLVGRFGEVGGVEQRFGMSRNLVWWAAFGDVGVIVKRGVTSAETNFYQQIAPQLNAFGIATPELYAVAQDADGYWIAIEYLPELLPQARWLADETAIELLRRLHGSELVVEGVEGWFRPKWDTDMTTAALTYFDDDATLLVAPHLDKFQELAQPLFEPSCWISGDPNPKNWGLRAEGEAVLFDWERFSRGTPALDLAITVPGMGSFADFERVAVAYGADEPVQLAAQMVAAKVWTFVEILANARAGNIEANDGLKMLTAQLASWLVTIRDERALAVCRDGTRFDVSSAEKAVVDNQLEAWLEAYLSAGYWANHGLRDGLKLAQRWWIGPVELPLSRLTRKCGPEPEMEYRQAIEDWQPYIEEIARSFTTLRDMPPLIVDYDDGTLWVSDGNHRYGALEHLGIESVWVLAWFNSAEDYERGNGLTAESAESAEKF